MIFYLAALQQIRPHLRRRRRSKAPAAGISFRRITFPLLMPTTLFVSVNAVIDAFRLVDQSSS